VARPLQAARPQSKLRTIRIRDTDKDVVPSNTISLFIAYRRPLVEYATGIVGSRAHAEDVVQEAWFRLSRLDDGVVREPRSYLYRLVHNLAIDTRRRIARELGRNVPEEVALSIADEAPSSEQAFAGQEELRLVLEALAELPERTRLAVRLNRVEGLKLKEVAERLGMSVTRTHALIASAIAHCDRWRARASRGTQAIAEKN
jgi:RNA polymerase sigma-70 factor (ECF subfamily)